MRYGYAMFLGLLVVTLTLSCQAVHADDAYSGVAAGGLVFRHSTAISMDSEMLEISPSRIVVSYEFKNNSNKDVSTIVAFPLPPIKCGWFQEIYIQNYPSDFETIVNGVPIHARVEKKAFIRNDDKGANAKAKGFEEGQDVTQFLRDHSIPVDCRRAIPRGRLRNIAVPGYIQAIKTGLAFPGFKSHPYSIYYETHIKYFWHQIFPAHSTVRIMHAYRPADGGGAYEVLQSSYPVYWGYLRTYQQFFGSQPQLAPYLNGLESTKPLSYLLVRFVLKSATTWDGPIQDFRLIINKPHSFVVTSMRGTMSFIDGNIVIEKKLFVPSSDLEVFYVGDWPVLYKLLQGH